MDSTAVAPALAAPGPGFGDFITVAASLLLLLGVLYAGFWLLKRFGPRSALLGGGRGPLKMEGHLALGPRRSVVVVRFLNKRLVLGVTDHSINLLHEADDDHDRDHDRDGTQSFEKTLERARDTGRS